MTATAHFLTGAALAAALQNPVLALPLAFVSHYALDAMPHFGIEVPQEHSLRRGKIIIYSSIVDGLLATAAILFVLNSYPFWYTLSGVVAYSPDFAWWYEFTIQEKFGKVPPRKLNPFNEFHSRIQKYERVWALVVDIAYIGLLVWLLMTKFVVD